MSESFALFEKINYWATNKYRLEGKTLPFFTIKKIISSWPISFKFSARWNNYKLVWTPDFYYKAYSNESDLKCTMQTVFYIFLWNKHDNEGVSTMHAQVDLWV